MPLTLTFTRTILVGGTPTDADVPPVLTDAAGTYGVRRTDTGAVVVAAETVAGGITHAGTGKYAYTLADAVAGVTYEAAFKFVVAGQTSYTSKALTATGTLTSRPQIEATGLINTNVWADAESDGVYAEITAQFDRVVAEAELAARETADEAGALDLWPLATTDAQYYALQRAATDFAVGRLQQIRSEPVAAGKEPVGITGERVARQKMLDVWRTIQLRADNSDLNGTAAGPIAETVTYFPPRHRGCYPACGPVCG